MHPTQRKVVYTTNHTKGKMVYTTPHTLDGDVHYIQMNSVYYPPHTEQGVHIEYGVDYTQSKVLYTTPNTKYPTLKVVYTRHFTYRMKLYTMPHTKEVEVHYMEMRVV